MEEAVTSMTGLDKLFLACAVFSGILLAIRMVLQFVGGGDGDVDGDVDIDADVDVDVDADVDVVDGEAVIADSGASFRLLTFQGLTGFFMMFGLVGLALSRQSKVADLWAIAGGLLAGAFTLWVIAKIFQFMKNLQSSGTIDVQNAVGQEGTVYLTIPAGGTGKAQVTVQERLKVYEAVSEYGEEIPSGEQIKVVKVVSGNILVVEKM